MYVPKIFVYTCIHTYREYVCVSNMNEQMRVFTFRY